MKILAIETSCDETAAAIISEENQRPMVLANVVASQINLHQEYGGVVPEVAARAHVESIVPVINKALKVARTKLSDIDRIAVTQGPGLIGSLVVGINTAQALSQAAQKPLFGINHLAGHIYANFIKRSQTEPTSMPQFPLVALIVSGGHTLLIYMKKHLNFQVIGCTLDDAAGEAFDKGAKILGLPYPGGPAISSWAEKGKSLYSFPVIDLTAKAKRNADGFWEKPDPSLDFSFSGLKTALLNQTKKIKLNKKEIANLASSYQDAIVKTLVRNSLRAIQKYRPKSFILAGGVAANRLLRESLSREIQIQFPKVKYFIPALDFCTDNAAMIGAACYFYPKKMAQRELEPQPSLELKPLS